ncbi:subtype B tannase [Streptomyces sp. WI04-05B]|uniref:subtype B tannase n=1 Tax=Streptomyces TaxID=1883 RepID=UPI0029A9200C|nr:MULTISPECIES: subtype B tannase [unclassified Streptomyces]MDX2540509.1 Tat pathway signal sequence domain protein [Streptomyces sp. WI04-05B]MDX2585059.1 Tat pathway signal sequence domain protein [Streptomyces sp. WI04-05A]MDX3749327.1 Tat pathway signal sequence domain protein [Streptomyces sp. AK08-02]
MKRRTVIGGVGAAVAVPAIATFVNNEAMAGTETTAASTSSSSVSSGALAFDRAAYTELTTTITTDAGDKSVTYHFYKAITYVTNPVDEKYQSLNVSVPVEIDGTAVDATHAPILFANSVGGYMPSSVADATGIGAGGMGGAPGGGAPTASASAGTGEVESGGNAQVDQQGEMVSNAKLGLAAGYVVVEPGARGRTLVDSSGTYYGTAPAAIVDLKAAVRYVRFNKGRIPGNTDRIVSSGTSAGGALSALLGASGDSPLYSKYLKALGAADASDAIFASGDWCPITDLEHADMAYEWNWGANKLSSGSLVDQSVSKDLSTAFADYQASLRLRAKGFGSLTARNLDDYLLETHLRPAATRYLNSLSESARSTYLAANTFITWADGKATFTWADFLTHVGARKKDTPAFDAFDLSAGENNLFGAGTTQARHFTLYSLRHEGSASARLDGDLPEKLTLMNPMPFLAKRNPSRAKHWWIRVGTKDSDTSLSVVGNLAASLEGLGDDVNAAMYWDSGHGANDDAADFITWIAKVTGYKGKAKAAATGTK